jgi:molecular chaperone GrpE (heat shock protein)
MKKEVSEIEGIITNILKSESDLKNIIEQKELEKQDQLKEFALSIIDVLDSIENIESSMIERGLDKVEDIIKTMKRYNSVSKKLILILQKHGITRIDFLENMMIADYCEVIEKQPDISKKNDEIVSIIRNGYIRGKELIRPAQVIIIKN